jgi:hypothetical protein
MADDGRAGQAKQIAMGLRAAGIDLTDESAVQRWIDERNESHRPGVPARSPRPSRRANGPTAAS